MDDIDEGHSSQMVLTTGGTWTTGVLAVWAHLFVDFCSQ